MAHVAMRWLMVELLHERESSCFISKSELLRILFHMYDSFNRIFVNAMFNQYQGPQKLRRPARIPPHDYEAKGFPSRQQKS